MLPRPTRPCQLRRPTLPCTPALAFGPLLRPRFGPSLLRRRRPISLGRWFSFCASFSSTSPAPSALRGAFQRCYRTDRGGSAVARCQQGSDAEARETTKMSSPEDKKASGGSGVARAALWRRGEGTGGRPWGEKRTARWRGLGGKWGAHGHRRGVVNSLEWLTKMEDGRGGPATATRGGAADPTRGQCCGEQEHK